MDVKLLELKIKNFKGIADLTIKANGANGDIYGPNKAGKSTVADAFYWLIDNKDSERRGDFPAITQDEKGVEIKNLNAEVEALLLIDDELKISFKKVHKQLWVRTAGKAQKQMQGHTTLYYVNGAKQKRKKDFDDTMAQYIDPKLFRMLSDVGYFIEKTKIDFRRSKLMELSEDFSDEFIISQNPDLAPALEIIGVLSPEDAKADLRVRISGINEQLEDIPKLIAENKRQLPDVSGLDKDSLNDDLARVMASIDHGRTRINDLENGLTIREKWAEVAKIDSALADTKNEIDREKDTVSKEKFQYNAQLRNEKKILEQSLLRFNDLRSYLSRDIEILEKKKDEIVSEWQIHTISKFLPPDKCPECGQAMPPELIAAAKEKFKGARAEKIKKFEGMGKAVISDIKQKTAEINDIDRKTKELRQKMDSINDQIKSLTEKAQIRENEIEKSYAARIDANQSKRAALIKQIESLTQNIAPAKEKISVEIAGLTSRRMEIEKNLRLFDSLVEKNIRIKELESELKTAAVAYEDLESRVLMIERFQRAKNRLIEASVSKNFRITEWRLFEPQINGGYKDICEPVNEGIMYSTALNKGSKINVGLDIIDVFSKKAGIRLPVFVDNAESVSEMLPIDNQVIALRVVKNNLIKLEIEFPYESTTSVSGNFVGSQAHRGQPQEGILHA